MMLRVQKEMARVPKVRQQFRIQECEVEDGKEDQSNEKEMYWMASPSHLR
jgi:hypothetical protein